MQSSTPSHGAPLGAHSPLTQRCPTPRHRGAAQWGHGRVGGWLRTPAHPSCPLPSLPPPAQPVPGSQPSSSTRRGLPRLASLRGAAWWCPSEGHTRTCRACTIRANIHTVEGPFQFLGKSYEHRGVCSGCHHDPAHCAPPSAHPPNLHGMAWTGPSQRSWSPSMSHPGPSRLRGSGPSFLRAGCPLRCPQGQASAHTWQRK